VAIEDVEIDGIVRRFSEEVYFGERVGVIGPNGTGKTHLIRLLAGDDVAHRGSVKIGNRVSTGLFTQLNARPEFAGRRVLDIVVDRVKALEAAMRALARYGLQDAANRAYETLSGGQRARLEILCLDVDGHNLLLLDEPTDNLDIDSAEALETALDGFEGTVVAVTHDRTFLRTLDRFLLLDRDGSVRMLPDLRTALEAIT
jgi:ATPase subunit of ABC transporter with duplicated ATPase domains